MNKMQIIQHIAKKTGLLQMDVEAVLNLFMHTVQEEVTKGGDVTLMGFGTFTSAKRKARKGYDPHHGKEIQVPEMVLPKFKPGKEFKEAVKKSL